MKNLRKVLYAFVITGLVGFVFALGGAGPAYAEENSGPNAQGAAPSEATVSLSAEKEAFSTGEEVILHVAISNPHAGAIRILKWFLPADGMQESLLSVTRDGVPVAYQGPVFKRRAPAEEDYLVLQPGETVSGSLDLSAYYDLAVSGDYSVTYDVHSEELYARPDKELLKVGGQLVSNKVQVYIEGRAGPSLNAITPEVVNGSTTFTSCSATRQSQLITARNDASNYAANSIAYLNAGRQGPRYVTWFGTYLLSRYNTVKSHFANINNAMANASVNFNCTCNDPNVYAYVFRNQPYKIYLCGAFWGAPATGTDSKAGTLVHEMSHFIVVADTDDWVYGQTAARNLAINDPAKAVTNADNHEYFAENTPNLEPPVDSFEPDNSSGAARTIALGATQVHSILPTGDVDWVKFQLTAPGAVVLETSPGQASGDTEMWLYDSVLTQLHYSDDEGTGAYSYINTCGVANLPAGTYYVKVSEFGNNEQISAYRLSLAAGSNCVAVNIGGSLAGVVPVYPGASARQSFAGVDNGPVQVSNVDGAPIVAAEREIYKANGVNTSFSEMMGLPNSQLSTEYWLPWYNNVNLDSQLRFGNVSGSTANVNIFIGGQLMAGSPFTLGPGESTRVSFPGVDSGPVRISSNVNIVAAERVIYKVNNIPRSFSELMALPTSQLSTTYWLPWYDNVTQDTQLRFANITNSTANVNVYIGGQLMTGSPFTLGPNESTRVSFVGANGGPVRIESNVNIVAAERVIYSASNGPTSFSEMMALPNSLLNTTHWLPWYNNVDLSTDLRIGNTTNAAISVQVFIGGVQVSGSPFNVPANQSIRRTFAGINNGLVRVVGNGNVVVSEGVIYRVNNVNTSFSELLALPNSQLSTTYWLPWYNNVGLDSQLRFGVP
jgi:peptidyl-Lys metalloendopeptidase